MKKPGTEAHKTVPVEFQRLPVAPIVYAHGAWGGVGPRGDVIANFYVDDQFLPNLVITPTEGGTLREVRTEDSKTLRITRSIVATVLLNPQVALSVGEWLVQKAKEAKAHSADVTPEPAE
jgi:hypothetical protein